VGNDGLTSGTRDEEAQGVGSVARHACAGGVVELAKPASTSAVAAQALNQAFA
jgi:hypothetical protein